MDARLKLRIPKGLFVPFEVLWVSNSGQAIHHYLRTPFMATNNDPKLRSLYPPLSIERWTDTFIIFMHFFCMRFPKQREHMHPYLHIVRCIQQTAPSGAWRGYDREFRILRQSDPSLPWQSLHPQLYFFHVSRISSFVVDDSDWKHEASVSSHEMIRDRSSKQASNPSPSHKEARQVFRKGYCTHHNLHGTCKRIPKCTHLIHRCSRCEGKHAALRCSRPTLASRTSPSPRRSPSCNP